MNTTGTDELAELEKRLDDHLQSSLDAEKIALEKLAAYPGQETPSPIEILRRERLRHRTQTLLLKEIKGELNLTYMFIAHDLSVIGFMCDRVAVMEYGKLVEIGPRAEIFGKPKNSYTRKLLESTLSI